jgi:hypothetical protein
MNKHLKLDQNKLKILRVKDKTDNMTVSVDHLFDVPMRLIIVGKSGSGKGGILTNLFLNDHYQYDKVFEGDRIFIFAPDSMADEKLKVIIEQKDIPDSNLFDEYDDDILSELYDTLVDDFKERMANKEPIKMSVIILDDLSFSGKFASRFNSLCKIFCNARKFFISVIVTSQAYTQIAKNLRLQASGVIIFQTTNKELATIASENNYLDSGKDSDFIHMFREHVSERHDFLCINYSNKHDDLYLDKEFRVIKQYL